MRRGLASVTLLVAACQATPFAVEQDALLDAPDAATRQAIQRAASDLFDGAALLLADDAFTRDSSVSIAQRERRGPDGLRIESRDLAVPHVLTLRTGRDGCVLWRPDSGRRATLPGVRCRPA
ncbi:hypothetical protein GCM10025771_07720 [Niveibacterium umoris]